MRSNAQRRLDAGTAQQASQTTTSASSLGRALLSFCLVLLVLGVLPATFVVWVCLVVIVIAFLRVRRQAQHLHQALEQQEDAARRSAGRMQFGVPGGPVVRVIPGGGLLLLHTDPQSALERLNMQLRHLDEEMGYTEEDLLLLRNPHAAAGGGASGFGERPPQVTDADIAALPCYPYKPPRGSVAADGGQPAGTPTATAASSAAGGSDGDSARSPRLLGSPSAEHQSTASSPAVGGGAGQQGKLNGGLSGGTSGPSSSSSSAAATVGDGGAAITASTATAAEGSCGAGGHGLTCPVCLDAVAEGSSVMTLRCLHQFHASCITPWLRQQGISATCPMCKTPVFR